MNEKITESDLNYFCKDGGARWVKHHSKQMYNDEYKIHVDGWLKDSKVSDELLILYTQDHISSIFSSDESLTVTLMYENRLTIGTYTPQENYHGCIDDLIDVKVIEKCL